MNTTTGKWMKRMAVLFTSCLLIGLTAVTASAAPQAKPSNLKVTQDSLDNIALLSWTNPRDWSLKKDAIDNDGVYNFCFLYSTDGQKTWQEVSTAHTISSFDYNKSSEVDTSIKTSDSFMTHGKTYYFKMCYVDQRGSKGPDSNIVKITWSTASGRSADAKAEARREIKRLAAKTGTVTADGGYSASSNAKKGMKKVYNRGAYRLTVEIEKAYCGMTYSGFQSSYDFRLTVESKITSYGDIANPSYGDAISVDVRNENRTPQVFWTYPKDGLSVATFSVDYSGPGYKYVEFTLHDRANLFEKKEVFEFFSAPPKPLIKGNMSITKNSITFEHQPSYRQAYYYRKKGASSWKKVLSSKESVTIRRLKANPVYEVKVRASVKSSTYSGTSKTAKSKWARAEIRTARKSKPKAKSAYTSGASYSKSTIPGHWVTGTTGTVHWTRWEPRHTSSGTSYTVHLKMKKPKGVKGFVYTINEGGSWYYSKSAVINHKASSGGNAIGKYCTVKICSCTNKDMTGMSPWRTIKIRIR